jgi:hypothetical protein
MTEGTIEAWEAAQPPPPPDVLPTVLNLAGVDLETLLERTRLDDLDQNPSPAQAGLAEAIEVERRTVVASTGTPVLARFNGCLDPEALARLEAAMDGMHRPDIVAARSLETVLGYLRTQDDLVGPRDMLPVARWFGQSIEDLARDARGPTHRALLSVAAQFKQFTGWLWVDAGDHELAERSYDSAIVRAVESGNRALVGYLLACKSEQALTAGRAEIAVTLAQEARSRAWAMSAVPMAWASDLEGRAWARLGRPGPCNRRLDGSAELLARRTDDPPWAYHYIDKVLEVHTGICLTDLATTDVRHATRAIEIFDGAIAAIAPARVRDRAYYLACAAQAHARSRDPERAGEVAIEATTLAAETNSTRVLRNLRALYGTMRDHRDLRTIKEFGELLKTAPPS